MKRGDTFVKGLALAVPKASAAMRRSGNILSYLDKLKLRVHVWNLNKLIWEMC